MLLALIGPTGSGKTDAAVVLAENLRAEIVSVDSMLVYRGMDVGTAKPTAAQRARVPHHLLDLADPSQRFTVARFQEHAKEALPEVERPLLVGGSGLYFRAVVDDLRFPPEDADVRRDLETEALTGAGRLHERLSELDPVAAERIEPGNIRRVVRALEVAAVTGGSFSDFSKAWDEYDPTRVRVAGVRVARDLLADRIRARVLSMLESGWLGEVERLVSDGFGEWLTSTQAIGYSELAGHLEGRLGLEEAVDLTIKRTRELARRQMVWFSRDPRVVWFDAGRGGAQEVLDQVSEYLEGR